MVVAHYDLLRATHAVYRARDRTKLFWVEHWMALLESTNMVGPHTGDGGGGGGGQWRVLGANAGPEWTWTGHN